MITYSLHRTVYTLLLQTRPYYIEAIAKHGHCQARNFIVYNLKLAVGSSICHVDFLEVKVIFIYVKKKKKNLIWTNTNANGPFYTKYTLQEKALYKFLCSNIFLCD